jgi:IS5 family transposase
VHRLNETILEQFFNDIITVCIERNVVKSKRLMIDSTDVEANTNYPSKRSLINEAYHKLMKQLNKYNDALGKEFRALYTSKIDSLYENQEVVRTKEHAHVSREVIDLLYLKTYDLLDEHETYREAFELCYTLIQQGLGEIKSDLIVSTVDPEARVAHKSRGVVKRGYKDHLIVDEDSEIIVGSVTTPFNVGDEKILVPLVNKATELFNQHNKIVEEVCADKYIARMITVFSWMITTSCQIFSSINHLVGSTSYLV